jgi:hypothetical protein
MRLPKIFGGLCYLQSCGVMADAKVQTWIIGLLALQLPEEVSLAYDYETPVRKLGWTRILKKIKIFFLLKINFFIRFESFGCVNFRNDIFKNKKNHFDIYQHEKHFKKQS